MAKDDSKFQIDDLVTITGTVTHVSKDNVIQVKLNTHNDVDPIDFVDGDLTLKQRPLKPGSPVKHGKRKIIYGTFVEATLGGALFTILRHGGKEGHLPDYDTVPAIDVTQVDQSEYNTATASPPVA